jgi:transketolase
MYTFWDKFMKYNPADPKWFNRDRFILSPGHGSALLYAMLHLAGYGLTLDELKEFRQWGSRTPGHPEYGVTPGVDFDGAAGLGHGLSHGGRLCHCRDHVGREIQQTGLPHCRPLYVWHCFRR